MSEEEHPSGVGPELPLAEPAQRLVARLVDTLIIGLPVVIVARALFPDDTGAEDTALRVFAPLAIAVLLLLYEPVQLMLWGRTLGKRFAGLEVVSTRSGERVDLLSAVIRSLVYALPIALRPVRIVDVIAAVIWVAGIAWLLERPRRQALHDRLADTVVVDARARSSG